MANVMQERNIKNNVNRSGFDLSFRNMFSNRTGEIMPVGFFETLPGDKWKIKLSDFMRTQPFNTASFARLRNYVDVYFVPNRLLWKQFPSWVMQTKNAYQAKSVISGANSSDSQPYLTGRDIFNYYDSLDDEHLNEGAQGHKSACERLLLNFGYTLNYNNITTTPFNIFPLLAYQKVYQDFFRFPQWEDAAPWTYNLDYIVGNSDLQLDLDQLIEHRYDNTNFFQMRYCNYDKDLFNGLLPNAQFGDEALVGPLHGSFYGQLTAQTMASGGELTPSGQPTLPSLVYNSSQSQASLVGNATNNVARILNNPALYTLSQVSQNNAGIGVIAVRMAEQLQKWKEVTQSGSPDYKEQLYKHWNVRVPDALSDRCVYLGGCAENVNISEVQNQNLTGNELATLKGKGQLSQDGYISYDTNEHGIILIVSHVKPVVEWDNDELLHPSLLRHTQNDYAIPEFDSIGMQAVRVNLVPNSNLANRESILGYAPRYFDYKTNYDRCNGFFLTEAGSQWVLPHNPLQQYIVGSSLTANSFRVRPDSTDKLFLADCGVDFSFDADPYLHSIYVDAKVVRNLSYDGLPY